jgi:hypothetical protein
MLHRVGRYLPSLALLALLCLATAAFAQSEYPRIGLSAARDVYLDQITVQPGEAFTLYATVMGPNPGMGLNQPLQSLAWVIHQVCCGGVIDVLNIEYNPDLHHEGHPLAGVVSTADNCLDQDSIWLATLTVRMVPGTVDSILWAAGPYGAIRDCDGQSPVFLGQAVTILPEGSSTPNEPSPWGHVKAMYR